MKKRNPSTRRRYLRSVAASQSGMDWPWSDLAFASSPCLRYAVDDADLEKMSRTKKYGRLTDHIGDF